MMRSWPLVLSLLSMTACSASDPCAGMSGGICMNARVEGAAPMLDQLRFRVANPPLTALSPTTPGAPFSLPQTVALLLPQSTAGTPVSISVEALSGGAVIAGDADESVVVPPSGSFSHTFHLAAGAPPPDLAPTADGAVAPADLASAADLAPTPSIALTPAAFQFATVPRASLSTQQALFMLTNNTPSPVTFAPPQATGDAASFAIASQSCPSVSPGLAPNASCSFIFTFKPDLSGTRSATFSVTASTGDMIPMMLSGMGTPAWSTETVGGATTLNGVWGSAANDVYAVGGGSTVYHTMGDGTWTAYNTGIPAGKIATSISGVDATHVFLGTNASAYFSTGTGTWTDKTGTAFNGSIHLLSDTGASAMGITETGNTYYFCCGNATWGALNQVPPSVSGAWGGYAAAAIGTFPGVNYYFVGAGGHIEFWNTTNGVWYQPTSGTTASLYGAWAPGTDLFAVGDGGAGAAVILHCTQTAATTLTCAPEASPLNGRLNAVWGRKDAASGYFDLVAVGALGNKVLRSTSRGVWVSETTSSSDNLNAVWMASTGEIFAAGVNGAVLHYY
ncbi:MAG TPA: hypothetical protein VFF06_24705 [Polyangia bacterium]|nr:hypothetical protein [Polyangia bacterium]